jgi:UDP-glucose 4-epimerase
MRILVTGGAGFIGSNVVDGYLAAGHEVSVVDDLSAGAPANVSRRARVHQVDVRSDELDAVVAAERPDVISHHAAQVSVRRSVEEPIADAQINVLGSLNVLEAARRHNVRRVIFASTGGAIYGEIAPGTAADERHPCRPQSPYAVAKLAVEHYLEGYRAGGLETVVLRYANVYGPRQDPHGEAGVIAIFIQRILGGLTPVIFGDGEQVRDFVFVEDVVRANVAALTVRAAEPVVVNVATGRGTSVNALWRALAAVAQPGVSPYHEPARAGDVLHSVLDPGRARALLGWQPTVALEDGVRRTWTWFVSNAGVDREHEDAAA